RTSGGYFTHFALRRRRSSSRETSSNGSTSTRTPGASDTGCDRDPAAGLLLELDPHGVGRELERRGDVVANAYRERLAERALVPEAHQVELERLRLEAQRPGPVADGDAVHVGLARDRAHRGELVADELDVGDAGVREALETRVVLGSRMAERHELRAA